jgi:DNA-binding NarL/FixJ family response regulator
VNVRSAKGVSLTRREREIVTLVAEGLTNKELADRLCISEATVRTHLTSIFLKLGVCNRLKLAVYAYEHDLAESLK